MATTITFDLVDGIPVTLVSGSVLARILRNVPHGRKAVLITREAEAHGFPPSLGLAVYAIETSFRPWWVQIVESSYLAISVVWWLLTGRGFRNLTVGPFQIGCHIVADYIGIQYCRKGRYWYPARSRQLALALLRLPFFKFNLKVAAYRLQRLWQNALISCPDYSSAVVELGTRYNGYVSYGWALLKVMRLFADRSKLG